MQRICFFDLETRNLFRDLDPTYQSLSFSQKKELQKKLTPQLGLATACMLADGSKPEFFTFDGGREKELIEALDGFDLIVGHNILDFDYLVLSPSFSGDIVAHFRPRTCDTLEHLKTASNGSFIGLDDLAKQNLGLQKDLDPMTVPSLWLSGQKDLVRQYCKKDVELLKEIYFLGKKLGKLKYTIKSYGVIKGIGEVSIPW